MNVTWKTTNEVNTDKFELLRKGDEGNFVVINTQAAYNTAGEHQYGFTDRVPLSGNSYYQLKQYDKDGQTTTSEIRIVNLPAIAAQFRAYPNPTSGLITVEHATVKNTGTLSVYDTQGQQKSSLRLSKGQTDTNINLAHLANGFYIIKVDIDGQQKQVKVIKK